MQTNDPPEKSPFLCTVVDPQNRPLLLMEKKEVLRQKLSMRALLLLLLDEKERLLFALGEDATLSFPFLSPIEYPLSAEEKALEMLTRALKRPLEDLNNLTFQEEGRGIVMQGTQPYACEILSTASALFGPFALEGDYLWLTAKEYQTLVTQGAVIKAPNFTLLSHVARFSAWFSQEVAN